MFLLRAQDKTAAATVRVWADKQPYNSALRELTLDHARLMDAWPIKKTADL